MNNQLKGKDFLATNDFEKRELDQILDLALKYKKMGVSSRSLDILKGMTLLLLFFRPSTRTRMSFTAAMEELGGFVQSPDPAICALVLRINQGQANHSRIPLWWSNGMWMRSRFASVVPFKTTRGPLDRAAVTSL